MSRNANDSTQDGQRSGLERYHFVLRRLHSLTGIIPVGAFLVLHILTNFNFVFEGPEGYNREVRFIHKIPYLPLVEWVFIFLPLAYHAGYGMFITFTGKSNVQHYRYGGNLRYTMQRVTGILVLLFVIVHLAKFRFAYLLPDSWNIPDFNPGDAAYITSAGLDQLWVVIFYIVGVAATAFHFSNGIWTFLIVWGITLGPQSQRKSGYVCAFIGVGLGIAGIISVLWFHLFPAESTQAAELIRQLCC